MDERTILEHIHHLVDEEHVLRASVMSGKITSDEERARLRDLEQSLDQAWDLLRRRRAARDHNQNPDTVQTRAVSEVESYLQ
jgi:Protein of unknown function (DUF2630)